MHPGVVDSALRRGGALAERRCCVVARAMPLSYKKSARLQQIDPRPAPGRPHFSNFGPPAERRPFRKKRSSVSGKRPGLVALVCHEGMHEGHEGRWATL